ncbi:hypothetical protein EE36_12878 [Sulfitobacter sp. EE-36]|nr:hypothetical protein EE36_12878 [Sulfitobacter sp. EE-36]
MPFDFEPTENNLPQTAMERARDLQARGFTPATIAVALRPYCRLMQERNNVLRELLA